MNERKIRTQSLTSLRLLPLSLIIRTLASICMLADLFVTTITNSGILPVSKVIDPGFEVMVLIVLSGYIIGIYSLSGLREISPKLRISLKSLTAVTVIACAVLSLASWEMFMIHEGYTARQSLIKQIIDISFFALVIVESAAVKFLLDGLADYLVRIGRTVESSRSSKLGAVCFYVNSAMMALTMIAALIDTAKIGYLLMIVLPVWTIMFLTVSIVVHKNAYDIWQHTARGARI